MTRSCQAGRNKLGAGGTEWRSGWLQQGGIDSWWKIQLCLEDKGNVCVCSVALSSLTFCNPLDCSTSGSTVYGIFQARILEWVAISSSRGSSWPRDWTRGDLSFFCLPCWQADSLPMRHLGNPWRRCVLSHSLMSDSLRPHGPVPTRLLWPGGFSRQEYAVDCHALLQGLKAIGLTHRLNAFGFLVNRQEGIRWDVEGYGRGSLEGYQEHPGGGQSPVKSSFFTESACT